MITARKPLNRFVIVFFALYFIKGMIDANNEMDYPYIVAMSIGTICVIILIFQTNWKFKVYSDFSKASQLMRKAGKIYERHRRKQADGGEDERYQ